MLAHVGRRSAVRTAVGCTAALLERLELLLERAYLLRLDVLVHALPLQPTSTGALARAWSLDWWFQRSDHEVVEFREYRRRKGVNLELNLLGTL